MCLQPLIEKVSDWRVFKVNINCEKKSGERVLMGCLSCSRLRVRSNPIHAISFLQFGFMNNTTVMIVFTVIPPQAITLKLTINCVGSVKAWQHVNLPLLSPPCFHTQETKNMTGRAVNEFDSSTSKRKKKKKHILCLSFYCRSTSRPRFKGPRDERVKRENCTLV